MRPIYHPEKESLTLEGILYALSDPYRLSIVHRLSQHKELSCSQTDLCNLPKSTLSHHFKILRDAGLVHSRKSGVEYVNTLRQEDIDERFPGLLTAILKHFVV